MPTCSGTIYNQVTGYEYSSFFGGPTATASISTLTITYAGASISAWVGIAAATRYLGLSFGKFVRVHFGAN